MIYFQYNNALHEKEFEMYLPAD